ncbi:SDR family oxidoreductase [Caulobacter sp. BK020]|uniref:SDR family NAD(P)-dependent oxidoreductase n=1 Tax=Caulobacter sp. BK020 TaxID=2512117 RepID=UPI00104DFC89|nr:SDR family oxidoreductase [Caulobacter sp. BK020]TCS15272.1 NAD(P)-dependent dehydrogenase (short-subunit alcohol dehydrogenase family) [Caulobacter sp. BK020]
MSLDGRVAIVTGAAGGIGLAIARRYARDGARVVMTDLQAERGEHEALAIRSAGGWARFIACDTADEAAVEALVETVEAEVGPIGLVVCSAGISKGGQPFYDTPLEDFTKVLSVNLVGPFIVGKAVARRMIASGVKGAIIHISSVGSVLGVETSPAYCTSKGGLSMLTKVMALAMAKHGVRVNAIGPGPTWSPMTEAALDQPAIDMMLSRTPMGRFADADEVAGVAAFLASEDASYITGQTLYADGGRLALNYVVSKPD